MPIDKHGFLGEEIEKCRQQFLSKFGERFAYYKKLNKFLNAYRFTSLRDVIGETLQVEL